MTLSMDIQHNNIECHYAECRDYLNVRLSIMSKFKCECVCVCVCVCVGTLSKRSHTHLNSYRQFFGGENQVSVLLNCFFIIHFGQNKLEY
jgi:hypothetical protein